MTRLQATDAAIRMMDRNTPDSVWDTPVRDALGSLAGYAAIAGFWLLLGYCLLAVQP